MKHRTWAAVAIAAIALVSLAACSQGGETDKEKLTILIGSSGEAETSAVRSAAAAWAADNKTEVEVVAASDLTQQLSQGFAGDSAPDLFYMSWDQFANYAKNGYLDAYAKNLANASDFYPNLSETFTFDGSFMCAPKDFSTLGLVVNTDLWTAAGLTDVDVPTDWEAYA